MKITSFPKHFIMFATCGTQCLELNLARSNLGHDAMTSDATLPTNMCWLMHKVKQKGSKNGIRATPPILVSLSLVSDLCQLQDHASLNPAVMVCSCLEITKQEHHTYESQQKHHTYESQRTIPWTTLSWSSSYLPQHPRLLRRYCPHWKA